MTTQEQWAKLWEILVEVEKWTEEERAELFRKVIRLQEVRQAESTSPALEVPEGASNG